MLGGESVVRGQDHPAVPDTRRIGRGDRGEERVGCRAEPGGAWAKLVLGHLVDAVTEHEDEGVIVEMHARARSIGALDEESAGVVGGSRGSIGLAVLEHQGWGEGDEDTLVRVHLQGRGGRGTSGLGVRVEVLEVLAVLGDVGEGVEGVATFGGQEGRVRVEERGQLAREEVRRRADRLAERFGSQVECTTVLGDGLHATLTGDGARGERSARGAVGERVRLRRLGLDTARR
mmetsp:Transcript_83320/g.166327  ORF Transcript_83320/g.166327 Transcript_83320/m.166327 type:complete len:232 (+) Transcript_83320:1326-2021(+)